jgi:small subunit ribosomal protein S4
MLEGQFALTFDRASQEKGVVGEKLLQKLERRLDNVVYRLGFGSSRAQARQLVRHGHVRVNDRKLNVPSFQVSVGDTVGLGAAAAKNALVAASVEAVKGRGVPKWLELDSLGMKGKVLSLPARDDVNFPIQEQLIVELYSK